MGVRLHLYDLHQVGELFGGAKLEGFGPPFASHSD